MGKSITFSYFSSAEPCRDQKVKQTMTQIKDLMAVNLLPFIKNLPLDERQTLFNEIQTIQIKLENIPNVVDEKVVGSSTNKETVQHTFIFDVETESIQIVCGVKNANYVRRPRERADAEQN